MQAVSHQKNVSPPVEEFAAKCLIHIDGRMIPIQDRPLNESATLLLCDVGHAGKKRGAKPAPAKLRTDEQILQIQTHTSPCRVIAKEKRKGCGLSVVFGDQGAKLRICAEAVARDVVVGYANFVRRLFKLGKFPDHPSY